MDRNWLYISTPSTLVSAPESPFSTSNYQAGILARDLGLSAPSPSPSSTSTSSLSSTITASSYSTICSSQPFSRPLSSAPTTPISSPLSYGLTNEQVRLHVPLTTHATLSSAQKINMHLLRSCALLACAQPVRALQAADIALKHAGDHGIGHLVSKAHLYRGLALARLGRWQEADRELDYSGKVRGLASGAERLREGCLLAMDEDFRNNEHGMELDIESITGLSEQGSESEAAGLMMIRERDVLWGVWPGNDEK